MTHAWHRSTLRRDKECLCSLLLQLKLWYFAITCVISVIWSSFVQTSARYERIYLRPYSQHHIFRTGSNHAATVTTSALSESHFLRVWRRKSTGNNARKELIGYSCGDPECKAYRRVDDDRYPTWITHQNDAKKVFDSASIHVQTNNHTKLFQCNYMDHGLRCDHLGMCTSILSNHYRGRHVVSTSKRLKTSHIPHVIQPDVTSTIVVYIY